MRRSSGRWAPHRKHILHVIDSLNPSAGGPSEVVRALFQFAPEGHTGEVVTLDPPGSPFLASYPFTVHALGTGQTPIGYSHALDLWLRLHRERFDGAIIHGLWRYVSFATWRAMHGTKPYVVFIHGMLDPYFKRQFPLKHLQKWVYWLLCEYWVLRGAHRVLFTTEEESRLARRSFWLHRWQSVVVALGASQPVRDRESLRAAFLGQYPELNCKRFLLFLGRIHRKKGCDLLIRSFVKFADKDPELHLVIAGPDEQNWRLELQQIVRAAGLMDRVHWLGMLAGVTKSGAFCASEAFILPSHQENFGVAVAEAMAFGRPVLLSDKVNIAPEIASRGAGLMKPDTQAGTDQLVASWIKMSPEERKDMGTRAQETASRLYDMRKNAAVILQLFETVPS